MCLGNGSSNKEAEREAQQQAAAEQTRQNNISLGTTNINNAFNGFNDDYYNGLSDKYTAYAQPQLDKSYAAAKQALTYSLAQTGNLTSTAAAAKMNQLQDEYNQNKQDLSESAQSYVNAAKDSVENHKTALMQALQSTADPQAAATDAASRAQAAASAATTFSPAQFTFSNLAGDVGNAATAAASGVKSSGVQLFGNSGTNSSSTVP